jgi:hypothetical protein
MDTPPVPVNEQTRSAAHWAVCLLLGFPMVVILLVAGVLKVTGRGNGQPFFGLLMWVVLIGLLQFIVLIVGRGRYLSGVPLRAEGSSRPPQTDVGIFHHE